VTLGAPARAGDAPVVPPGEPAPAAAVPDLESHLDAIAPAIVTLQVLLKYEGDFEGTTWAHGAIVEPSGLVMLSNADLGAGEAKIADVKVLLGNDPKEWQAVLVARDSALDLAYVQVLGLGEKRLPALDLAKALEARASEPRLGETLFGVTRAGRGFDYAPAIRRLYFSCRIESPRRMWDLTGEFFESGLPVFDLAGRAVAVLVNQASTEGADEGGGSHEDVFALPLAPVVKSLAAARRRVPDALEKADKAKKDAKEAEAGKPR
jgi:S1-C subfamily serine protease